MSEELKKEAGEAGDMHSDGCCMNTEYGCDSDVEDGDCCDNMKFIASLIDKATLAERKKWENDDLRQVIHRLAMYDLGKPIDEEYATTAQYVVEEEQKRRQIEGEKQRLKDVSAAATLAQKKDAGIAGKQKFTKGPNGIPLYNASREDKVFVDTYNTACADIVKAIESQNHE
ncbi:MAG TPA: hypothetical protein ENI23_17105 [bacterium]|nr:hypothetical protein [bacterium]